MADISEDAVRAATGKGWSHWFAALDQAGAASHAERARHLGRLGVPDWWCQMVTVQYEKERGLRVRGQTSAGDFQAGAQRTLPVGAEAAWAALLRAPWLGAHADWTEGAAFAGRRGERVEVRAVRPPKQLRLWVATKAGKTTLEVTLQAGPKGTAVRFSQTGIASAEANEAAKKRWREALAAVADAAAVAATAA